MRLRRKQPTADMEVLRKIWEDSWSPSSHTWGLAYGNDFQEWLAHDCPMMLDLGKEENAIVAAYLAER